MATGIETLGLPRYLAYFTFAPLWETFFGELGVTTIPSPPTNMGILDDGVKDTVNDACIPIKIFHGHVMALRDQVDAIFIPRLACYDGEATFCPKFLGLPDMVRHSCADLPTIIAPRLDVRRRGQDLKHFLYRVGHQVTGNGRNLRRAYLKAINAFTEQKERWQQEGLAAFGFQEPKDTRVQLGLLGYPYMLYDRFASGGLIDKLHELGVRLETPDTLSDEAMKAGETDLVQNMFWYYSNRAVWAGLHFLKRPDIDGLIHVTAFGCGPDAMVDKVLELECKQHDVSFMSLTIDELTGDAGLSTRLEAFVDMLVSRKRGGRQCD